MYQKHLYNAFLQRRGHLQAKRERNGLSHHRQYMSIIPSLPLHVAVISASLQMSANYSFLPITSTSAFVRHRKTSSQLSFSYGRSSEHVSAEAALRPVRKRARSQRMASKAESCHHFQCMQVTHTLFLTTSAFRYITAFFESAHSCRSVLHPKSSESCDPSLSLLLQRTTFKTNRAQP